MAIQTVTVELDGQEIGSFGINATTTPNCAKWQQVYDTLGRANIRVSPDSRLKITSGDDAPRSMKYSTFKRYLDDCQDEVE